MHFLPTCLAAVLAALPPAPQGEGIKITVAEPAGLERKSEPAWGGVPFQKGKVKSVEDLALFSPDGKPVPAQFSKLAPYDDGSVQWALVDLLADLPAGGRTEFVIKTGKAA